MKYPRLESRWSAWAAIACLLAGIDTPFAGFSGLLTLAFGERPNAYLYALSWAFLGPAGMVSTNGFLVYFANRNRRSIQAGLVCVALFALSALPVVAMGRAVAAITTGH